MHRLLPFCLALALTAAAWAKLILEITGSISGQPSSRVDLLVSSDKSLGSFSILRMSSWGRGRGTQWVEVASDQLQELQRFTQLAASGGPMPKKAEILAGDGMLKIVRTPKGEVQWRYTNFESPTVLGSIGLSRKQALDAAQQLGKLRDRLAVLARK